MHLKMMYRWLDELAIWWVGPHDESAAWRIGDTDRVLSKSSSERFRCSISEVEIYHFSVIIITQSSRDASCIFIKWNWQLKKITHLSRLTSFGQNSFCRLSRSYFLVTRPCIFREINFQMNLSRESDELVNAKHKKQRSALGQCFSRDEKKKWNVVQIVYPSP